MFNEGLSPCRSTRGIDSGRKIYRRKETLCHVHLHADDLPSGAYSRTEIKNCDTGACGNLPGLPQARVAAIQQPNGFPTSSRSGSRGGAQGQEKALTRSPASGLTSPVQRPCLPARPSRRLSGQTAKEKHCPPYPGMERQTKDK